MILTGPEISKQVKLKRIIIDPFDATFVNPNSYNYRIGNTSPSLTAKGRPS